MTPAKQTRLLTAEETLVLNVLEKFSSGRHKPSPVQIAHYTELPVDHVILAVRALQEMEILSGGDWWA